MSDRPASIVFLSGAGGGAPDPSAFGVTPDDASRFVVIGYPGWRRYLSEGFSAEELIADLTNDITTRVPQGPIHIIGLSIGGHFGYAIALRLQKMGREIGGFCAIDTFMISSAKPSMGWKARALEEGWELLRKRRFSEFVLFSRSKFWRALIRVAGGRLQGLKSANSSRWPREILFLDPLFENEFSMRLLIEIAAPWIASLDRSPAILTAPAVLLRTDLSSGDDVAWRHRCPNIDILEITGQHHSLFELENVVSFRSTFLAATANWGLRCIKI